MASEASLCYVDIDKCRVQLPEEMAAFPHLDAFNAEIWAALDKHAIHVPNAESNRSWQVYLIPNLITLNINKNIFIGNDVKKLYVTW